MTTYNAKEKYLAGLLSKLPGLKKCIKFVYQKINFLLYRKKYQSVSQFEIQPVFITDYDAIFFGYYDKSPINEKGKLLICHAISQINRLNDFSLEADILVRNLNTETYDKIDSTSAYNWQQGCRLQWISDIEIIYNVFDDGLYKSKIYNTVTNKVDKFFDLPVYDCYKDKFALSVSFERLAKYNSDYGYFCSEKNDLSLDMEDGIFLLDLKSTQSELLYSIKQAGELQTKASMQNADHLFNHLMISPDGTKFIFIHRWYKNKVRYDRLLLFDLLTKKVTVLVDDGMVSHCYWKDDTTVAGYFKYNNVNGYYKISIIDKSIEPLHVLLTGFPDGHPSFYGDRMIFDTYPDKSRMQNLYLLDFKQNKLTKLGEFLAPFKFYAESRCDLHPKWSADGKSIFIDSTHEGKRNLYQIDLEKEI